MIRNQDIPKNIRHNARRGANGYTIVELMVALIIFGLVMTGLVKFSLQTGQILFDSSMRLELDADIRKFSQQFNKDVKTADAFYLYKSFIMQDRNDASGKNRLGQDESGDFLLLVYTEPQPYTNSTVYITKLIGYFRKYDPDEGATSRGEIYRFEMNYPDETQAANTTPLEAMMASYKFEDDYPKVLSYAIGLYDNHFFRNHLNKCVMVGAELYRGHAVRNTTQMLHLMVAP